jgi:GNAT superfamily N-acetyltransferase
LIRELDPRDDAALARCFEVFSLLRPHLDLAAFSAGVRAQTGEGYPVHYVERDGRVAAAAGWRVARFLAWGKVLYVDDLIAHPERRREGHGGALLDWLFVRARELGCDAVHLDSGHQRHDAHRLYLNKGFVLSSHHFAAPLC